MSKEKKISIRHFDNKKLKPTVYNNTEIYPLYFQITFQRRGYNFRCNLIDDFVKNKLEFPSKSFTHFKDSNWENIKKDIIKHNTKVIELVIEKIKGLGEDLNMDLFKDYYDFYSKNLFILFNRFFLDVIVSFLKSNNKESLLNLIKYNEPNVDMILEVIKELNPDFYNELYSHNEFDYRIYHEIVFHGYLIAESDFTNQNFYNRKKFIANKTTFDKYLSIIEWENYKSHIITQFNIDSSGLYGETIYVEESGELVFHNFIPDSKKVEASEKHVEKVFKKIDSIIYYSKPNNIF